jgi:hypothetical protein
MILDQQEGIDRLEQAFFELRQARTYLRERGAISYEDPTDANLREKVAAIVAVKDAEQTVDWLRCELRAQGWYR